MIFVVYPLILSLGQTRERSVDVDLTEDFSSCRWALCHHGRQQTEALTHEPEHSGHISLLLEALLSLLRYCSSFFE